MKKNEAIQSLIYTLRDEQLPSGGFCDLLQINNKTTEEKIHSIFTTAWVLNTLSKIELNDYREIINQIKNKAADFLLQNAGDDWRFAISINTGKNNFAIDHPIITFFALSALMNYDKKLINGEVVAKTLIYLTNLEKQEGGPYYDILNGQKLNLATNLFIAYFLSLHNVNLPNLDNFIKNEFTAKNFFSDNILSEMLIINTFSSLPKNDNELFVIKYLLSKQNTNKSWGSQINTAATIASLANLNYPISRILGSAEWMRENIAKNGLEIIPIIELGNKKNPLIFKSNLITACLCLQVLAKFNGSKKEQTIKNIQNPKTDKIYEEITTMALDRFSRFDNDLKKSFEKILTKIIRADRDKQIVLLPYLFNNSLSENKNKISSKILKYLGLANLYLWIAYTIYDDFLDDEGRAPMLSVANICLRECTQVYQKILPTKNFATFNKLMDTIDAANSWEVNNCRRIITDNILEINPIPDYKKFQRLSERSIAHALGPIAILTILYDKNNVNIKYVLNFFHNYLVARQLNDDAHDWEEDLSRGHINSVVAEIFKTLKTNSVTRFNLIKDMENLQKKYWLNMIEEISNEILKYTKNAHEALDKINCLADKSYLSEIILPIENSANQAISEKKQFEKFFTTYSQ